MRCSLRNFAKLTFVILMVHVLAGAFYSVIFETNRSVNDSQNIKQMKREALIRLLEERYRPWNSSACTKQGRRKPIQYIVKHHLIVSERYKTLFCFVPKVACSNWKRIFHVLDGHFNSSEDISHETSHDSGKLRFLRHYSNATVVNHMLKTYKKIAFVREPMERFLSAYRSKFAPVDPPRRGFYYSTGLNIIKRMRKNSTGLTPHYPTFKEFANFAITTPVSSHDEHWDRQHNLCAPCDINYDFVGFYDNIKADADLALMLMGADEEVTFPNIEAAPEGQGSQTKMKTFYSGISQEEFTRLQNIYAKDYDIFGFKKPSYQEIVNP
ncbi:carbohydrate sulfotransferase 11-like isoform X1 [Pocillopora verrucosa]|uniref:carbohydrate sulfotransferase 11-like isoform X1 n=2 Tax=Pocillopora verrucosa TaxID=203993 RepID=UPI002797936E|nr:carbohydrate sulfotransferase 11-like isoform X1 [Pocillopora verrucosa]